jgi:LemA protein
MAMVLMTGKILHKITVFRFAVSRKQKKQSGSAAEPLNKTSLRVIISLFLTSNQTERKMKKGISGLVVLIVIVVALLLVVSWGVGIYNKIVPLNEKVATEWSNVETQYQRRADLIPNFVNTVKGAAEFEQETLTRVIEARAKATSVTVDPSNITPEQLQQFQAAQGEVSSALQRLMVVVERYPELKATQNFRDLQVELEGTENRIAVARNNFNDAARVYNTFIKQFPNNLIASFTKFNDRPYFEAQEGTEVAPRVEF